MLNKMELYKFQSIEDIERLEDFFNQKIWLQSLAGFNDPFEGTFKLVSDPIKILKNEEALQFYYDFQKKKFPDLTMEEFKKSLLSPEFNELRKKNENLRIKDLFSDHGAFCLAKKFSNSPMWAHYANNHRGYCVVFDVSFSHMPHSFFHNIQLDQEYLESVFFGKDILSFYSTLEPEMKFVFTAVNYDSIIPIICVEEIAEIAKKQQAYNVSLNIISKSLGVKSKDWGYEQEFRLIANTNSKVSDLCDLRVYIPFLRAAGVIMGSKLSEEERRVFYTLAKKYGMRLYQAECSDTEYEIIRHEINLNEKLDNSIAENKEMEVS